MRGNHELRVSQTTEVNNQYMERESFIFYKEWKDAIKGLPESVRLEIYEGIIDYATSGEIPDLKTMANVAFQFVKHGIDRDIDKYKSVCERNKENIKKRYQNLPKSTVSTTGSSGIPLATTSTKSTDNDNDNDIYKENTTKVVQKKVGSADPPTRKKKSKEEIELELKERMNDFYESLAPFVELYGKEMIRQFYDYWIEPNKSKTKMRFETQATWDLKLRLSRWSANDKSFTHGSYTQNNSKNYNIDTAPKNYHERM